MKVTAISLFNPAGVPPPADGLLHGADRDHAGHGGGLPHLGTHTRELSGMCILNIFCCKYVLTHIPVIHGHRMPIFIDLSKL